MRNEREREARLNRFIESALARGKPDHQTPHTADCCTDERLVGYIENTLYDTERAEVEAHLAQCDLCLHEWLALYEVVGMVNAAKPEPVPERIWQLAGVEPPTEKSAGLRVLESVFSAIGKFFPFVPSPLGATVAFATGLLLIVGAVFFLLDRGTDLQPIPLQSPLVATAQVANAPDAFRNVVYEDWLIPRSTTSKATEPVSPLRTPASVRYFRLGVYAEVLLLSRVILDENTVTQARERFALELLALRLPDARVQKFSRLSVVDDGGPRADSDLSDFLQELDVYLNREDRNASTDFAFGKWTLAVNFAVQSAQRNGNGVPNPLALERIKAFRLRVKALDWSMRPRVLAALDKLASLPLQPENLPQLEAITQQLLDLYLLEERIDIKNLTDLENRSQPFTVETWLDSETYPIGSRVHYRFRASADCYVTLLYIDGSGKLTLLFPNPKSNHPIQGNQDYTATPEKLTVNGPSGRELILAIATTEPLGLLAVAERHFEENPNTFFTGFQPSEIENELRNREDWTTHRTVITIVP
jgi:hypothetical protein